MDVDTPTIEQRIVELQSQVAPYSHGDIKTNSINLDLFTGYKIYVFIPIAILILLIFSKPGFTMMEITDDGGQTTVKLSFQKLFLSWIIISGLLVVGLFGYNYKNKK